MEAKTQVISWKVREGLCLLVHNLKRSPARQLQLAALEIVTLPRLKLLSRASLWGLYCTASIECMSGFIFERPGSFIMN